LVVGSNTALKGVKATATAFTEKGGENQIPSTAVLVRYGLPTSNAAMEANGPRTHPGLVKCDALDEVAPAELPVNSPYLQMPWQEIPKLQGAVMSVW